MSKQPIQLYSKLVLSRWLMMNLPEHPYHCHAGLHTCQALTFLEDQLPCVVCSVHANVLLYVCVFMVVDSQTAVSSGLCQPPHQAGLARRGGTLQQHRKMAAKGGWVKGRSRMCEQVG